MKLPNPEIDPDDAMLFGSLFLVAVGSGAAVFATAGDLLLAFGVGLIVFGLPSTLLTFMAASEEST